MTDTIKVGDFVTAKSRKYENHQATGYCLAIEGDKIVVRDLIGIFPYECDLEGAVIVPVAARVTASRADDWQPKSDPLKLPARETAMRLYKDSTPWQALLAGIATSTVAAVRSFIDEHSVAIDTIKVELRCTSHWVTDRPSQNLGGGMIACGEGHRAYQIYLDVSITGDIDDDTKLKLKCRQLTFHQIHDLDLLKARVHIDLR